MRSRIFILFLFALAAFKFSEAQDIHFSQFYTQDWLVNPAKVGFFNGNYKLSAAYRNQWNSVTTGFETFAVSGEMSWAIKGTNRNILGMELHAYSDKAGDAGYTTNNFGYNISYTFCLDRFRTQFVGFGSGISYVNNHFDPSKLQFENDFFGLPSQEMFLSNNLNYADMDEGVEYNYIPNKKFNFNAGAAIYHINTPNITYTDDYDSKLYRSYIFNAGCSYSFSYAYSIYPRVIVDMQGPYREINAGTFVGIRLDKDKESEKYRLYFGSWYRVGDAIIAVSRIDMDNMSIGLSYDINISKLYIASEGRGGPELTLTYNGFLPQALNKKVNCPKF